MDVHLTRDGQVVVSHDNDLKRCAGVDNKVSDMNYDVTNILCLIIRLWFPKILSF